MLSLTRFGSARLGRMDASTAGGLFAIVLWSTTFALARSLSEQVGPFTAGAAVYLVGAALTFPQFLGKQRRGNPFRGLAAKYTLGCGALFVLYTVLIYIAVGLASTRGQLLEIALVNYLWPAATILLSVPLLRKKAGVLLIPGTIVSLFGVFLVPTQSTPLTLPAFWDHARANPLAFGFVLLAAVAWALYSNLARRWSQANTAGGVPLFVAITGLMLLAFRFLANEQSTWTLKACLEAFALGAVTTLGYGLWDLAMRKGDLLLVVLCSYFTPLLSTIVSCLYLQVAPGERLWWGCGLLVGGTLVTWRSIGDGMIRPKVVAP
jgi:drug/metabolite transporter (DMT)-like permease